METFQFLQLPTTFWAVAAGIQFLLIIYAKRKVKMLKNLLHEKQLELEKVINDTDALLSESGYKINKKYLMQNWTNNRVSFRYNQRGSFDVIHDVLKNVGNDCNWRWVTMSVHRDLLTVQNAEDLALLIKDYEVQRAKGNKKTKYKDQSFKDALTAAIAEKNLNIKRSPL